MSACSLSQKRNQGLISSLLPPPTGINTSSRGRTAELYLCSQTSEADKRRYLFYFAFCCFYCLASVFKIFFSYSELQGVGQHIHFKSIHHHHHHCRAILQPQDDCTSFPQPSQKSSTKVIVLALMPNVKLKPDCL